MVMKRHPTPDELADWLGEIIARAEMVGEAAYDDPDAAREEIDGIVEKVIDAYSELWDLV